MSIIFQLPCIFWGTVCLNSCLDGATALLEDLTTLMKTTATTTTMMMMTIAVLIGGIFQAAFSLLPIVAWVVLRTTIIQDELVE